MRMRKRLADRPHRLSRKPSEEELKEILSHFSRREIWDGIRAVRRAAKPKFRATHGISLQITTDGTLVWRFTTPLRKTPIEIGTGVKARPPRGTRINSNWWVNLPPEKRGPILEASIKAAKEQREEEHRAYIVWNAIFTALSAACLIFDSTFHAGMSVGDEQANPDFVDGDVDVIDMILPFFECVGIDVGQVMKLIPLTKDHSEELAGDDRQEYYA